MKNLRILFALLMVLQYSAKAQIASYVGTSGSSTSISALDPNITVTSLQSSGFSSTTTCGSGGLSGLVLPFPYAYTAGTGAHVYFKITPNSGYHLDITGWTSRLRASNNGPTKVIYAYSLDNGVTWTDDYGWTAHTLSGASCGSNTFSAWGGGVLPTNITASNGIILALFPYQPAGSGGAFQVNRIDISGNVISDCTPPVITVSAAAASICAGAGGTVLTASGAGVGGSYSWSPSTGLSASTGDVVTANPSTTTTYVVTGTNATSCSATTSLTVTVNNAPTVPAITGSTSVCAGGATTTLNNTVTGGTWSVTNTSLATITSSGMVTGVSAGTDTVKYAVTNTCGTTTVIFPITINPLPNGGAITGADSVCAGSSIVLANSTATPGGSWSSANTLTATVSGSTVWGASAGTVNISYSVTTVCGTAYAIHPVTVNPLPVAGTLTGSDSVCYGTTISLTPSVSGGVWSSANNTIASVTGTGVVQGISATMATTNINYTVSTFSCGTATVSHAVTVKPQPFAGIASGAVVCHLASTTVSSTAPGGVWSTASPGIASISPAGTVTGITVGQAVITYTVINSCGTATDTALVTINPLPPLIDGNTNICIGVSTSLTDALPGGMWSTSDAAIASVNTSGIATGMSLGTATITYTNSTTGCYTTIPVVVNLSVTPGITIAASTPVDVCSGTTVTYTAFPVNGGTSPILVWSINDTILANGSSYTYTPLDGDLVRCWMLSSLACAVPDTASDHLVMNVHHIATPSLTIATGMGDTVCQGTVTTFTPAPTDGGTAPAYQWYVNTLLMGVGSTFSYIPTNGDVVSATMTSNEYCRTTDHASTSRILTVSPYVTPMVSTTVMPGLIVCAGYPVTYSATQVNGGVAPTYQWLVNGVNSGTGDVFSYLPANGDQVQVVLTSSFPCLAQPTGADTTSMTVVPVVQPIGEVTASPGYIINEGAYDTFRVNIITGGGDAPTYQWFKNEVPVTGATNNIFITNNLSTGDSVNCVVTNTDQCSGISVFNYVHIIVGSNVGVSSVTSGTPSLAIAPNPAHNMFTIKGQVGTSSDDAAITITDIAGRQVYTATTQLQHGTIEMPVTTNDLAAGAYLLSVRTQDANTVLHLVID